MNSVFARLVSHGGFLAVLILIVMGGPFSEQWTVWIRFENVSFNTRISENYQIWRMLTGHFCHASWGHFGLNLLAYLIIYTGWRSSCANFHIVFLSLFCSAFISLYIVLFDDLDWYVGYSGVLHGLVVFVALRELLAGYKTGWLMLGAVIIKLFQEQWFGVESWTQDIVKIPVYVDAHMVGAIAGGLYCLGLRWLSKGFFVGD